MASTLAHAKLNLLLEVKGRRADGYHELEMVNVSLDLADRVHVEPAARLELAVTGGSEPLPADARNLAWRAAEALGAPAVRITLEKEIPVGAGLAGGSTDAAAVLRLLGAERSDLPDLGLALGADVPYCLDGRPALVGGIGERLHVFRPGLDLHLVVANPGFAVSTREIFTALAAPPIATEPAARDDSPARRLVAALTQARDEGDLRSMAPLLDNDLEAVTTRLYPAVAALRDRFEATGALAARMSGSGPTVYGLYANAAAARAAAAQLEGAAPFLRVARVVVDPYARNRSAA